MLLGTGSGDVIQNFKNVATQSFYYAFYAQDDWHVSKKLTLNLGVRWDINTPRTERYNRMNYFDPSVGIVTLGDQQTWVTTPRGQVVWFRTSPVTYARAVAPVTSFQTRNR